MISFGLVNIPIGVYPATEEHELAFHMLHAKDSGRIKNQRVCTVCEEVVAYDDIVKGYEYQKGSYVEITEEDLEKVHVETSQAVSIVAFVDAAEIDPMFFDKPYYIVPGKSADGPYTLLREALRSTGKVGVAKVVLRSREHLAAIRVSGDALMLDTMHFPHEIREAEGIPAQDNKPAKRELEMAEMLINAMSGKFDPSEYKDTYTDDLEELIKKKVAGEEITTPKAEKEPTNVIDIMAQLKASLEGAKKDGDKRSTGRRAAA
jgi:DNA end-binding protein Ku